MVLQRVDQDHQVDPSLTRTSLNLLLFVAKRAASVRLIRQLQDHLAQMTGEYPAQLEVVEIGDQPYLAEHYKLVAMPALVKTFPHPAQVLAGGDLTTQLDVWWPRWQGQVSLISSPSHQHLDHQEDEPHQSASSGSGLPVVQFDQLPTDAALLQMSEELFALQQERDRLLKQLHFKDRILAMLMHDLRNPLTAASMAVETTEHQEELDPEFTRYWLEQARQQLRKIDLMTCDILEASRGTNAELVIQVVELDVVDLCMGVLEDFTHRIRAKSLTVETDLPSNLPTVQGDPAKIRQVIVNLLDNAIKYTPTSGIIWVSALHRTAQKIQITVSDTGPGVPVEAQERIFSDTVRLDRDQNSEGYGIGLSLCRRIVRAHYGQIWVEERAGGGSAFHFTLPVYVS